MVKGLGHHKRSQFDAFCKEEISPLIRAHKFDEAIEKLTIEWQTTGSFEVVRLFISTMGGILLASGKYEELLAWSEKFISDYPHSSHAWERMASTHFHAFHRPNRRPLRADIEKAFECWDRALEIENNPKVFYFIACNYLRALSKLKRWKVMEEVIARLPACLNPDIRSMDGVIPIENDWLTQCPAGVINQNVLNRYIAACETYRQAKHAFLTEKGLK